MSTTTGVPVWRTPNRYIQPAPGYHYFSFDPHGFLAPSINPQLGTWFPVAVAEARERVIEAARIAAFRDSTTVLVELQEALAALAALEGRAS